MICSGSCCQHSVTVHTGSAANIAEQRCYQQQESADAGSNSWQQQEAAAGNSRGCSFAAVGGWVEFVMLLQLLQQQQQQQLQGAASRACRISVFNWAFGKKRPLMAHTSSCPQMRV